MKSRAFSISGFSLVEVVLALAVSAFALITIMALLPAGLGASKDSSAQTEAMNLAIGVVSDLRQTPTALAIADSSSALTSVSPRYGIDVTKAATTLYLDSNGNSSTALTAASHYKVMVNLTQPSTGVHTSTYGNVQFVWPAEAPTSANSISVFVALDRN
jgi:uncharacterized protein (TIGR02598 family)